MNMLRSWWTRRGRSIARLAAIVVVGTQTYVSAKSAAWRDGPVRRDGVQLALPRAIPFELSNERDPARLIEARFTGWVRVDDSGVSFKAHTFDRFTYARVPDDFPGMIHPVGMGIGIARPGPAGFTLVADTIVTIGQRWSGLAGRLLPLPLAADFRFEGMSSAELEGGWPVVIYDLRVLRDASLAPWDLGYSEGSVVRIYAHGDPEIFRRLLTPPPWMDEEGADRRP